MAAKAANKPKKVDVASALSLRVDNQLSYGKIAAIQGVSKQAIHQALQDLLPTEETKIYRANRADIISNLQAKIIKSIDDEDIKKAPFGSRILAYAQLYDKERLERGQSTTNISALIGSIEALQRARSGAAPQQADDNNYET